MTEPAANPLAADVSALFERLTYHDIAKTIDHSLLRPELDDEYVDQGIRLAARYHVASVTVRPVDVVLQIAALRSGRDGDVKSDIEAVVEVAHAGGAIVKVIFENAYLTDGQKIC